MVLILLSASFALKLLLPRVFLVRVDLLDAIGIRIVAVIVFVGRSHKRIGPRIRALSFRLQRGLRPTSRGFALFLGNHA